MENLKFKITTTRGMPKFPSPRKDQTLKILASRGSRQAGFLHLLSLFTIFAAMLWYFQIDVRGFVDSHPGVKNSFAAGKDFFVSFWNNYFAYAFSFLWEYAAEFTAEVKEWF